MPSNQPSSMPSLSSMPSNQPSSIPSNRVSAMPSSHPSFMPSNQPSSMPSNQPSAMTSNQPSAMTSNQPSSMTSNQPSSVSSIESSFDSIIPPITTTTSEVDLPLILVAAIVPTGLVAVCCIAAATCRRKARNSKLEDPNVALSVTHQLFARISIFNKAE
mmetsp:Transcript_43233/g.65333  ORF Transcript_43233/g.65333 Transcript_43233/m.65333 type:complete len:160 (-) Transcript_43233:146-625(-)